MTTKLWTMHYTEDDTPFYYNLLTNNSQWDKPKDLEAELDNNTKVQNYSNDKPIKTKPIENSDYILVFTKQNFKFYFNLKTKQSSWEEPSDLIKAKENTEAEDDVIEMDEDDIEYQLQMMNELMGQGEEDLVEEIPHELKILHFQNLLDEIKVTAVDLWEDILPKIQYDQRYLALNNQKECKQIFTNYCKELKFQVNEIPKKQKSDEDFFKKILSKNVKLTTKWEEFNKKISVNPKAVKLPYKQRQSLFNEFMEELKSKANK